MSTECKVPKVHSAPPVLYQVDSSCRAVLHFSVDVVRLGQCGSSKF